MIQLSKRLNAVAELLVHGIDQLELEQPVLADIGTDHAYLPVYLVQKKVVKNISTQKHTHKQKYQNCNPKSSYYIIII